MFLQQVKSTVLSLVEWWVYELSNSWSIVCFLKIRKTLKVLSNVIGIRALNLMNSHVNRI